MGAGSNIIPGTGTFFVGIDVVPGRYRCDEGKGGWWVRFTGPGGGEPVGSWPLPAGPAEVEIEPTDFAFETNVGTYWRMVAPAPGAGERPRRTDPRPAADPTLRGELDSIVDARSWIGRLVQVLMVMIFLVTVSTVSVPWLLVLVPGFVLIAAGARMSGDLRRARALDARRDRYVTPEDLDGEGKLLLVRAQQALDTVQESAVNTEGLLDTVDNAVTLPRQEWEIAQVLARQSALRREQAEFLVSSGDAPEIAAALEPLRAKLEVSVQAVTRRVEALERYADRTREADAALHAQRHLETLAARAHEYDELVADSVRDELALPAIERLTQQSELLVENLRSRLEEASAAAEEATELPPPSEGRDVAY
jgi:hypothetical protein